MAKATVSKVYATHDELIHYSPNGFYDPCATLCGDVDVIESAYTETTKKVNCDSCNREFATLKDGIRLER